MSEIDVCQSIAITILAIATTAHLRFWLAMDAKRHDEILALYQREDGDS